MFPNSTAILWSSDFKTFTLNAKNQLLNEDCKAITLVLDYLVYFLCSAQRNLRWFFFKVDIDYSHKCWNIQDLLTFFLPIYVANGGATLFVIYIYTTGVNIIK